MLQNLPIYIPVTFALTTLATLILFVRTIKSSNNEDTRAKATFIFIGLLIWLVIQGVLTLNHIYISDPKYFPPKIALLGIVPTFLVIILLFITSKGRQFIDNLPLKLLTYLHIVRIPVEIVLFWLFISKTIP